MFHFGVHPQVFPHLPTFGNDETWLYHVSGAPAMRGYWNARVPGLPMLINGTNLYEYGALHIAYALQTYLVETGALHFSYILGGIVEASLAESAESTDALSAAGSLFQSLVAASSMSGSMSVAHGKNVDAELEEDGAFSDTLILNQTVYALITEALEAVMYVRVQGEQVPVWVVNTENWGATRFDNYSFNSFAKIGDQYYGASDDGLFELDGETDAGEEIDASALFRRDRAGSSQQKHVDRVYVHGTSDNKVEVRVVAPDGKLYAYRSEVELGDEVTVQRVKIGRGLVAQYWQMEVRNVAGGELNVDQIEVVSLHTTRKIRR